MEELTCLFQTFVCLFVCLCYSREVVQVLHAAPGPDGDPVDLVVQPVQEEAQELLSVLLAVEQRRSQYIHRP